MTSLQKRMSLSKYKILILGFCVLIIALSFIMISTSFLEKMYLCKYHNEDLFMPNTSITVSCDVVSNVWQDLTLIVYFHPNGNVTSISIPAHLEIKDPNDIVLYDMDFDKKTIISFEPKTMGTYAVTITNIEDENNRTNQGYVNIVYALGFLTSYDDVSNPMGQLINVLLLTGYFLFIPGIVIVIYGTIKEFKTKSIQNNSQNP